MEVLSTMTNTITKELDSQNGILSLAAAGVEFTLPNRGDKQPFTKGWPDYRPDLASVASHLANGHNLGIHVKGYTDGRLLGYFDADDNAGMAALLAVAPELRESLLSWRDSGSGKVFFWAKTDELRGQTTPDLDGLHSKREFKISGQAALAGIHPSGEQYRTNFAAPITLNAGRVREIWDGWTGQEWQEGRKRTHTAAAATPRPAADNSDVERVKAAWTPSEIFLRHWAGTQTEVERNGEIRILGRGGLLCNDRDGLWHSFAENEGGDVFNAWAFATGRDIDHDFPAILREMAAAGGVLLTPRPTRRDGTPDTNGFETDEPDQWTPIVDGIDRLRLHLRSVDFAELVPEHHPTETDNEGRPLRLQATTGYRTVDVDRVIADTALGYLWELRRPMARISNLELSERTGYSPPTCGKAMKRLCRLFEPVSDENDGAKQAGKYRIEPDALLLHTESTVKYVCKSSASVLATHRAHDVFARSLSALTPEDVAERNENRALANLPPLKTNRQLSRRLTAEADALGASALRLVDILHMYGAMSGGGLAALMFKSATAARRVVRKAILAGLVAENDDGAFILAPGWSERVTQLDAIVPTAGTIQRRRLAAADSRLRYCDAALATAQKESRLKELQRRKERATQEKWALIQGEVADYNARMAGLGVSGVTMEAALAPGRGETFTEQQRRRAFDAHADERTIRDFAPTLAGLDRETAEQTAYYCGYSNYEFAQAWALREVA